MYPCHHRYLKAVIIHFSNRCQVRPDGCQPTGMSLYLDIEWWKLTFCYVNGGCITGCVFQGERDATRQGLKCFPPLTAMTRVAACCVTWPEDFKWPRVCGLVVREQECDEARKLFCYMAWGADDDRVTWASCQTKSSWETTPVPMWSSQHC